MHLVYIKNGQRRECAEAEDERPIAEWFWDWDSADPDRQNGWPLWRRFLYFTMEPEPSCKMWFEPPCTTDDEPHWHEVLLQHRPD